MRVLGLGAGGHAKVVIEILRATGWEVVGLLDPRQELWGAAVLGVPVLGGDDLLAAQRAAGVTHAFVGLGSAADPRPRRRLYELGLTEGFTIAAAVHPAAIVSGSAEVGAGVTLMANAVVNAAARLGENTVVNSGAIIEHDCVIGSHSHVASGARLAGGVVLGEGVHVGLGACVNEGVQIGAGSVVGSGAVVVTDVQPGLVVAGVPARVLCEVDP